MVGVVACVLLGSPAAARADSARGPAYLVFAGPYSSSPSSAFGHLFLALADERDQAPPLWDVITFNAETFGADPLRYVTVGILGGFLGRYSRVSFHEKTREYGVLDDRDLWLLELRLTAAERAALDEAIRAREGSWYPYTFFSKNCAYYLQLLLAEVTGVVSLPSGTVSPTGVFDAVRGTRVGGPTFFRPAASRRLMASSASVAPHVRERLEDDAWMTVAADTAWHGALRPHDRRFVQQVLGLRSTRRSTSIPPAAHDGLARLRVANVRATRRPATGAGLRGAGEGVTIPASRVTMPAFHRYSRLRLLQGRGAVGEARTSVALRGAMHDEADPWFGHRPLNTMQLFGLRVSTGTVRFAPRVEEVVVFSQRALAAGDWIRRRRSWILELQARRGGLFSSDGMHLELRSGGGRTVGLPLGLHAYGLITVAGVGEWGEGAAVAPGLEAGLVALTFDGWRWGARWTTERALGDWSRTHTRMRAWARVDLGGFGGIVGEYRRRRGGASWALGLDWYP